MKKKSNKSKKIINCCKVKNKSKKKFVDGKKTANYLNYQEDFQKKSVKDQKVLQ